MTRYSVIIVLLVLALALQDGQLHAGQSTSFMVYGATQSCGTWTAENQRSSADARLLSWWVLWYVSGASVTLAAIANIPLAETDSAGIEGWITKYCADHPLDSLQVAAANLIVELRTRAKPN